MQVDLITEPRGPATAPRSPKVRNGPQPSHAKWCWATKVRESDSILCAEVIKSTSPVTAPVLRGKDPHDDVGQFAVYPTTGSLFTYQVPAFQAAVDAGVSAIMPYYNAQNNALSPVPQIPSDWWVSPAQQFEEVGGAFSTQILTKLLRERMGFKGVINTDSGILTNRAWGVAEPDLWSSVGPKR